MLLEMNGATKPLKSQIVADKKNQQIICTAFANGKRHDFRLFKESKTQLHPSIGVVTDSGYQGFQKMHAKKQMPRKGSKKSSLTPGDKKNNRQLSRERVLNETVIGSLKRFKIIADCYRNRRKRFSLRFNLIAGIYNWSWFSEFPKKSNNLSFGFVSLGIKRDVQRDCVDFFRDYSRRRYFRGKIGTKIAKKSLSLSWIELKTQLNKFRSLNLSWIELVLAAYELRRLIFNRIQNSVNHLIATIRGYDVSGKMPTSR